MGFGELKETTDDGSVIEETEVLKKLNEPVVSGSSSGFGELKVQDPVVETVDTMDAEEGLELRTIIPIAETNSLSLIMTDDERNAAIARIEEQILIYFLIFLVGKIRF